MKAAVVRDFHTPLEVTDVPMPEPGHGQVLVKIETSGLVPYGHPCGTWRLARQA